MPDPSGTTGRTKREGAGRRGWVPPGTGAVLEHLKVGFVFLAWLMLVRQQASVIVDWRLYYAQALVATAALALGSVIAVYVYPPRTARWRTVAWTYLASSAGGALAFALLGGRAGLLAALFVGALVLWARGEENGRRTLRALHDRHRRHRDR